MFFLLAAFMLVSLSMQKLRVLKMDLPTAKAQRSDKKPDVFNIDIARNGDLKVDSKRLSLVDMEKAIKERFVANNNLSVYIKADHRSTHGVVMNILDTVKAGGITSVSFAIDPPKE